MSKVREYEHLGIILDDFNIWSGQVTLQKDDLTFEGDIPSSEVINLGSKRLISREYLRPFHRIKTACRRFLLSYGMRFLNGVAVPVSESQNIIQALETFKQEFEEEKANFLANYDDYCDEWVRHHNDFKEQITSARLSREEVEKRLNFEYQVFLIRATDDVQAEKLEQKTKELGHDLLDEVVDTIKDLISTHFVGKKRVGLRVKNTLEDLAQKVQGLTFLHGDLIPLLEVLNEALQMFSFGSYVEELEFLKLQDLLLNISSRDRIKSLSSVQSTNVIVDSSEDSEDLDAFSKKDEKDFDLNAASLYF